MPPAGTNPCTLFCHSRGSGNPVVWWVERMRNPPALFPYSLSTPRPQDLGTRRISEGHLRDTLKLPAKGLCPSAYHNAGCTGTACRAPALQAQRAAALFSRSIMATPMPFSSVFSMIISSTASSSSSRNTAKICLAYSSSSCGMILTMGLALPPEVK